MSRRLTLSLALAVLVLGISSLARADTIVNPDGNGELIIPDGSLITDMYFTPPGSTLTGFYTIDWTFADGYGTEWDDYNDGGFGSITFTTPVSDLVIQYVSRGQFFTLGYPYFNCFDETGGCNGILDLAGPGITGFSWGGSNGFAGISSMTYTVDAIATPEPGSLVFLGLGLLALVGFSRRKNSVRLSGFKA